jgi:hypothetical protein
LETFGCALGFEAQVYAYCGCGVLPGFLAVCRAAFVVLAVGLGREPPLRVPRPSASSFTFAATPAQAPPTRWQLEVRRPATANAAQDGLGCAFCTGKGGARKAGGGHGAERTPQPIPPPESAQPKGQEELKGLLACPASKQCTAQHPTPAPPVVPRETLLPSTAARPSPRLGACPSSPSRCPAPPKPPPTRS